MNNSNELTILIRAKDEFSDIFKSFGDLCQNMQVQAQTAAEALSSVTAVIDENLTGLRQSYTEFAKLSAMFGGSLNVSTTATAADEEQSGTGLGSASSGNSQSSGIIPLTAPTRR